MSTATLHNPFEVEAKAKGEGGKYPVCPPGLTPGICIGLIDLGTHREVYKDSGKSVDLRKVALVFETTEERTPEGEPFYFAERYNLTFTEGSALRGLVEKWTNQKVENGERFDIQRLLGKPCMLNISTQKSKKGNDYAKLDGVVGVPRNTTVSPQTRASFVYVCDGRTPPPDDEWLPFLYGESIKSVIETSKEFGGPAGGAKKASDPGRDRRAASAEDDLYEILGVGRDAPEGEIKAAYRRLAKEYHPDLNPDDPDAAAKFRAITEAIEVLGNPAQRAAYDTRNPEAGTIPF